MNSTSSKYRDLGDFLSKHYAKDSKSSTHTRIPDKANGIQPGAFLIPKDELETFYALYYDHVFVKGRKEYLTERQIQPSSDDDTPCGPMAVDFDFRYAAEIQERQHTKEHILDMVLVYLDELKKCYLFEENKPFDVFIFEKPDVNKQSDITKDGIHMMIGLQVDSVMQQMIRDAVLTVLPDSFDVPVVNAWSSVLDEGITKGTTNWQLYGSRKPGHDSYAMTQHFSVSYDKKDGEFVVDERDVKAFNLKESLKKLSVQHDANPAFPMNPKIESAYNLKKGAKKQKKSSKSKLNLLPNDKETDDHDEPPIQIEVGDVVDKESLERAVESMLKNIKEHEIRETHHYTQILPEKYYEPGSHLLNRQVAFALKHTDDRLFWSWVQLRSKASDFDYGTIPELFNKWSKYFNSGNGGMTRLSIMYWAKQDANEEYNKVKNSSIDNFIDDTLESKTEWDLARVLKQMFKDKYVCASYANKGIWYRFNNHRWEPDRGFSLRMAISSEMYQLYNAKEEAIHAESISLDHSDENNKNKIASLKFKQVQISKIKIMLKKTSDKNNIFREATEQFYDKDFTKMMDTNKNLMCFTNGVVDFKNKVFREGCPQDYITKTTGIPYLPYSSVDAETKKDVTVFMEKLFPDKSLNKYMWDHLASCLIGTNKNQTFNVYHGSGSNGKSLLVSLMGATIGEYKCTVPITLVTEKRVGVGGTSSEIIQMKGARYAVMQEPSKGVKLNEGMMKELTGGDPIQARALFQESEVFDPQFSLVVCTNNLFDIDSNDDGTWRRICKADFVSKFVDSDPNEALNIYLKDKSLEEKLPKFAPVFASMLVERAFQTQGIVEICDVVKKASDKYRNGQDHLSAFINEKITLTEAVEDEIGKRGLMEEFKAWFQREQGSKKMPKGQELYEYMDKKFGPNINSKWKRVKFVVPEDTDLLATI